MFSLSQMFTPSDSSTPELASVETWRLANGQKSKVVGTAWGRGQSPSFRVEQLHVTSILSDNPKSPRQATPHPASSARGGSECAHTTEKERHLFACTVWFFLPETHFILARTLLCPASALALLNVLGFLCPRHRLNSRSRDIPLSVLFLRDQIPRL